MWALLKNFGYQTQKFSIWKNLKHSMSFQRLIRYPYFSDILIFRFSIYQNKKNVFNKFRLVHFLNDIPISHFFIWINTKISVVLIMCLESHIYLSISDHSYTINVNTKLIIIITLARRSMVKQKLWDNVRRCNTHNIHLSNDLHIIPIGRTNL